MWCGRIGNGFPRLRVGVRGSQNVGDLADYVLAPFDDEELERLPSIVDRAADAVDAVLRDGIDAAMNEFNRAVPD